MRILRVAQKLYPEEPGGGTYHVHAMSRDQAAMGHDVTVLTIRRDPSKPSVEQRHGYTVVRFDPTVSPLGNDVSLGAAQYLASDLEFDVVHAHSHLYFSTNLAALRRRLSDTPLAITNHGLYSQNAPKWVFDLYLRSLGRWTFNQADVVFCYTEEDRCRVREFGVDSRIEVVPNGVDTERFTPEGPESGLINHDGPVVLFVGRLVEGKRPGDAVGTVTQLPDGLNARLFVVGDGPLRTQLESDSDGQPVEFLGHVPYDEMPSIYRAGDVMILPSRNEGLPRTVLEAFASETPVVSSHLEQTAPIVREGGETVSIGDIDQYATSVQSVLASSDSVGKKGRQTVINEFQWQSTVERTTEILQTVN